MNLTKSQYKAISHKDGPMLVLAGPGSGKTTVLIERIRYLITEQNVPPEQILVVTFSKAAAVEMQNRFFASQKRNNSLSGIECLHPNPSSASNKDLLLPTNSFQGSGSLLQPNEPQGSRSDSLLHTNKLHFSGSVTFGTMHSIFYRILRESGNYDSLSIITTSKKYELIKTEVLKYFPEAEEERLAKLLDEISYLKNNQLAPESYESRAAPGNLFCKIYQAFQEELHKRHLIDFDDILLLCLALLQNNAQARRKWQKKFSYVLVDEFQDINPVQYKILCLLAARDHNLFVVGDDDQSIYGFRGAQPQIMRQFLKDHRSAKRILLDVNYRCGKRILKRSLRLISVNKNRIDKRILAGRQEQGYFQLANYRTQQEEFASIVNKIQKLSKKGVPFSKMSILFRNTFDAESMAQVLAAHNIPFRLQEPAANLFTTAIALDLIAFMNAASGFCSRSDFLRIMNKPSRYISRDALPANPTGSTQDYLRYCAQYYAHNPKMQKGIQELAAHLQFLSGCSPFSAVNYIRKVVGYDQYLGNYAKEYRRSLEKYLDQLAQIEESTKPFQSFAEWFSFIDQYSCALSEATEKNQVNDNSKFLTESGKRQQANNNSVFLTETNRNTQWKGNTCVLTETSNKNRLTITTKKEPELIQTEKRECDGVNLMTMHASKGLEFDTVFLPCLNQGIIPHRKAITKEDIEEERRLLYVAMTRAANRLYLSFSELIRNKHVPPSDFLQSLFL